MVNAQRIDLSQIDGPALSRAIREFDNLGRAKFLRQYGFGRSSKFYLLHQQKLYDTKSLVGASYFHATGTRLTNRQFSGGTQTVDAINKVTKSDSAFRGSIAFEDVWGELTNVSEHFDRLADLALDVREFEFSRWIQLQHYKDLHTGGFTGGLCDPGEPNKAAQSGNI